MTSLAKPLARPHAEEHEDPREHLMHDPLPRGKMNEMVMEAMHETNWKFWVVTGILAVLVATCLGYAWYYLIDKGLGVAGVNMPVFWGIFLVDVVFWIGISHAGTFISAILRVLKVESRRPFTRAAELMTTFGLVQAAISVFMHMGRVWLSYWMAPIPNERMIWPDFHSPLMWDFMAISTYLLCSTMYLFLPLIPDMAMARDRSTGWRKTLYKILGLGFRGTEGEWKNLTTAMNLFAFAIIPVMFSVHTIVSWDFAMGVVYGWHTTIFAPYFVAGAIFSGCAMVITLMVPMRKIFSLEKYITVDDFEKLAKLLMLTGLIVSYAYIVELALAIYSGNVFEYEQFVYRLTGDYAWAYWTMILCNVISPLSLFVTRLRRSLIYLWILSIPINIGMWFERFNIIVISLAKDFDPYNFGIYSPSMIEWGITIGSFGWFFMWFLMFTKTIPVLPVTELKEEVE